MKIVQTIPTIFGEGDGPGRIVRRITMGLAERGHATKLHVLEPFDRIDFGQVDVQVHRRFPWLRSLGISPSLRRGLTASTGDGLGTILHAHGLWMMPHYYCAKLRRETGAKLVHSPRGTLAQNALAFHGRRKKIVWRLFQHKALEIADLLHATAEKEIAEFRDAGLRNPIALISNGVELPEPLPRTRSAMEKAVNIGRLHPLKGCEELVRAWAQLHAAFPTWELWMVGPSENGYAEYLQRLARELRAPRIYFPGPLYGDDKNRLLSEAGLGVFPSHTENFGNAIGETLARSTPVLVSSQTPWGLEVGKQGCGWTTNVGGLPSALREALALPFAQRVEAGKRGRSWMEKSFSWPAVVDRFETTYHWVLQGGRRPEWIDVSSTTKVIDFRPRKAG